MQRSNATSPLRPSEFTSIDVPMPEGWPLNESMDRGKLRRLSSALRERSALTQQEIGRCEESGNGDSELSKNEDNSDAPDANPTPISGGLHGSPYFPPSQRVPNASQKQPVISYTPAQPLAARKATSLLDRRDQRDSKIESRQQAVNQLKAILQADVKLTKRPSADGGRNLHGNISQA